MLNRRRMLLIAHARTMSGIFLTKTTAAQNKVLLSYHRVRGLYFLVVVFAATIVHIQTTIYYIVHIYFKLWMETGKCLRIIYCKVKINQ